MKQLLSCQQKAIPDPASLYTDYMLQLFEIGNVIIAKMKTLEQPELLLESGVNCELSAKRIFTEEKVKYSLLLVRPGFPISISHGDLVEISQHRIYQFVGGFHLSHLSSHVPNSKIQVSPIEGIIIFNPIFALSFACPPELYHRRELPASIL
jgi:hypothetical protein